MSKDPIVRAIDIGYGNTKFSTGHRPGEEITCKIFPSLAPQASSNGDLGAGTLSRRETVRILVNDVPYEVGRPHRPSDWMNKSVSSASATCRSTFDDRERQLPLLANSCSQPRRDIRRSGGPRGGF